MKRHWFSQDSPYHWSPSSWEGWIVVLAWVVLGLAGGFGVFLIAAPPLNGFLMTGWMLLSAYIFVTFIIANADPYSND